MPRARRDAGAAAPSGDRLAPYRAKRGTPTPEPAGAEPDAPSARAGLRFVVQEHHATRLHWDLRLERDGVLVSFAIPNGIPDAPRDNRLAVRTEDHPLEYLDFEGAIPAGSYGAGTMSVWDRGTYETLKWDDDRKIEVRLRGERLDARYALFPIDKEQPPKDWMIHRMDPPADAGAEPMPKWIEPMLARGGPLPRDDDGAPRWAHEIKWDGVRAICHSEPGRLRLASRNGLDITGRYPELAKLNRALSHHRAILDGEIVALDDDGRPSFGALQRRMHVGAESAVKRLARELPVTYVIFDLLWLDGHPLMGLPYAERRERLGELALEGPSWRTPEHVAGHGAELLAASAAQGLEGIVAKRLDSPYEPGRRSAGWVKVKNVGRQEVVIGGWMPGAGRRRERIGALLAGVREDEAGEPGARLRYVGRVGSGFTEADLERLQELLVPLQRGESPFAPDGPKPPRGAVFVEPRHVAEVEFRDWTDAGQLRAAAFKGLRDDKAPELVVREQDGRTIAVVDGRDVALSNLDKILYPASPKAVHRDGRQSRPDLPFTKRDVIDYYARIAPVLLAHLRDRPLTLKRYPNGVGEAHFYEKRAPSHRPEWVQTARVGEIDYVLCNDTATLVWLANLADLELHTSLAMASAPQHPTIAAFDLDPGEPATIVECCRVALLLEALFTALGLRSFAKTSGSKGMQVYVPLAPDVTHDDTKAFARAIAELLAQEEPGLVVARQAKGIRAGKVLVDWSQNDAHKTTVSVYSLRAMARPTVSTPISWEEVRAAKHPEDLVFTSDEVLRRVADHGDLFAPVASLVQRLPQLG